MQHTYGLKKELLDEIKEIARRNKVQKVILFGSRARGDYKERSDIDIAFEGGLSNEFIWTGKGYYICIWYDYFSVLFSKCQCQLFDGDFDKSVDICQLYSWPL